MDALVDTTRKQNFENLSLMKGITKTMQTLKDNDTFFKENDVNTKDVMVSMIEYFN